MALSKALKDKRIAEGVCVRCGKRPALPNNQKCEVCRNNARESQDKIVNERIALGVCIRCGGESGGKRYCPGCYEGQAASNKKTRARRSEAGQCPDCGVELTPENSKAGNKLCDECIAYRLERKMKNYHERKRLGICAVVGCDNQAREGCVYCEEHLEQNKVSQYLTRQEREAVGLCNKCGERDASPMYKTCAVCRIEQNRAAAEQQQTLRRITIVHYGGCCEICGESRLPFLQMDHIGGGGNKHFESIKTQNIYAWLRKNDFPEGFRVLCCNHNFALGVLSVRRSNQATVETVIGEDMCCRCKTNFAIRNRRYCPSCTEVIYARQLSERQRDRNTVLDHYGPLCFCCGQDNRDFLQVDHIDGGGRQKRQSEGGNKFYRWIIRSGFPTHLRILCANCNFARHHMPDGVCPCKSF